MDTSIDKLNWNQGQAGGDTRNGETSLKRVVCPSLFIFQQLFASSIPYPTHLHKWQLSSATIYILNDEY